MDDDIDEDEVGGEFIEREGLGRKAKKFFSNFIP